MAKSAPQLASKLLKADKDGLEELRVHMFEDDESAHDDELIDELYTEFAAEFDTVAVTLSKVYGSPIKTGREDHKSIPLNGIFRFAVWQVEKKALFAAAAHEDRELPIILMLGTTAGG